LEAVELSSGVTELVVDAVAAPATVQQLSLFTEQPLRDLAAANRALARIRAEQGDDTVIQAKLRSGHLPEASYEWLPLLKVCAPMPHDPGPRPLVRSIHIPAIPLPHRRRHEEDGWLLRGRDDVPVDLILGPYLISGGWWRSEIQREYHFVQNRRGTWLWVYFDARRQRWFLQGRVG
jgi:protein ImuB